MTFTDPQHPPSAPHDEEPAAKPRPRARAGRAPTAAALPIQTRLVPNCAWPKASDPLPARRAKRR